MGFVDDSVVAHADVQDVYSLWLDYEGYPRFMNGMDEVAVVGYDDIQLAAYSAPPLTTVVQPKLQIGTLAAEMLLDRLEGKSGPPRKAK